MGFSLIELLVVLSIITILIALAAPLYSSHLIKMRRSNAAVALADIASQLEHYYLLHHTYQNIVIDQKSISSLINGNYKIQVEIHSPDDYLISAIPINTQAEDKLCGSLILEVNGMKKITGIGRLNECW